MAEPQHIQTIVVREHPAFPVSITEMTSAQPEHEDSAGYVSAGYGTSTASLSSSICEYVYENGSSPAKLADQMLMEHVIGRRYHAYFGPDKNLQPTDELEQDR